MEQIPFGYAKIAIEHGHFWLIYPLVIFHSHVCLPDPDAPCMEYLPTFGSFFVPYMEHMSEGTGNAKKYGEIRGKPGKSMVSGRPSGKDFPADPKKVVG